MSLNRTFVTLRIVLEYEPVGHNKQVRGDPEQKV